MKKLFFIFFIFLAGCVSCIKYPDRLLDPKSKLSLEPDSCYDYKVCMYYVATGKIQSTCQAEFVKCCKDRDFELCKSEKKPADMKFSECWDKLQ